MRRIFSTLFCLLLVVAAFAQSNSLHLKFMGIPITGTITQFQNKLAAKGVKYSPMSKYVSAGIRTFTGSFAGNDVRIYVYYDNNSKIVYRVKSVIANVTEDIADNKYSSMRELFEKKYEQIIYGEQENKESLSVFTGTGRIDMYICKDEDSYNEYDVHIDYEDEDNSKKHGNKLLDDI